VLFLLRCNDYLEPPASKRRLLDLFSEFSLERPAAEHVAAIAGSKSVSGTYRTHVQSRASLDERGAS
jgi:hypothetical protein